MNDEMSFDYYANNYVNETSKSYPCRHGVVDYHNGMICGEVAIVYKKDKEYVVSTSSKPNSSGTSFTHIWARLF